MVMRQFALLILLAILIWVFWMTWEWLRNKSEPIETDLEKDIKKLEEKQKLKQENEESI